MRRPSFKLLLAAIIVSLFSAPAFAGWQDQATEADQNRLARFQESKSRGLSEAGNSGEIRAVANAPVQRASASALVGNWRCRVMKLGGITPYVIYSWFNCRISNGAGGRLYFEKLGGSQRTSGYLYPDYQDGFVYLGASTVKGEPQRVYSGTGASVGASETQDDQIGVLSYLGSGRARLELPFPAVESVFDVIELKR